MSYWLSIHKKQTKIMAIGAIRTYKLVSTLLKNSTKCSCSMLNFRNFSVCNVKNVTKPTYSSACVSSYWQNVNKYKGLLFSTQAADDEKERQRREQERMHEEDTKKREADWKRVKLTFWAFGGTITILGTWMVYELGRPSYDENGNEVIDEFSNLPFPNQYLKRLASQLNYYKKMIQEPSREKLLPDPLTYPYIQPPYTLVLELRDVLVHPDWTYQTGWRFKKRPGVDHFLEQVSSPLFEIVVYTAEPGLTVFPLLDSLDPKQHIMYRLVKDSTHFVDGHHVKDLSRLNRDLSRVIVVDWNRDSVKMHPSNALIIPRWRGNDDDLTLIDLAALLRTIAALGVDDVRGTLEYYSQFDDPIAAFRENRQRLVQKLEEEHESTSVVKKSWAPSFFKKKLS